MPDLQAFSHSSTGNDKVKMPEPFQYRNIRHLLGVVPDWDDECQNNNAGLSFLDAGAQMVGGRGVCVSLSV